MAGTHCNCKFLNQGQRQCQAFPQSSQELPRGRAVSPVLLCPKGNFRDKRLAGKENRASLGRRVSLYSSVRGLPCKSSPRSVPGLLGVRVEGGVGTCGKPHSLSELGREQDSWRPPAERLQN